jgi:hypothetical protein
VRTIQEKSKTPIARVAKNGSVVKKTTICIKVDFDCLFLIDPLVLPMDRYDEFLSDVQDVLTLNFSSETIHVSKFAVTYFYKGFDFDFLPGPWAGKEAGDDGEAQVVYRFDHPLSSSKGVYPNGERCLGDQVLAEGRFYSSKSSRPSSIASRVCSGGGVPRCLCWVSTMEDPFGW